MLTPVTPTEGWSDPKNHTNEELSIKHPVHSLLQYLLSISHVPGRVLHAGDTVISTLEIVHVFTESVAQQERNQRLCHIKLPTVFKYLLTKPGLPDPECS